MDLYKDRMAAIEEGDAKQVLEDIECKIYGIKP